MNRNPEEDLVVKIWRLLKGSTSDDAVAITEFHELIDAHGCGEVRKALAIAARTETRFPAARVHLPRIAHAGAFEAAEQDNGPDLAGVLVRYGALAVAQGETTDPEQAIELRRQLRELDTEIDRHMRSSSRH